MIENLKVGDLLEHKHTYEVCRVYEINNQFGWYVVKYLDGRTKRYGNVGVAHQTFTRLDQEQKANFYLKLENIGLTDFWRED